MKHVINAVIAFVVFNFLSFGLGVLGLGVFGFILALIAGVATFLLLKKRDTIVLLPKSKEIFSADYKHDNIAIDLKANKLWVRDLSGNAKILDKNNVLRWELCFIESGLQRSRNRIDLHVNDLDRPIWSVPFKRHGTVLAASEKKNYADAEEWISRLTTWMKQ